MKKGIAYWGESIYPHTTGGLEVFMFYLISEISKHEEVYLFTKHPNNHFPNNVKIIRVFLRLFYFKNKYFKSISLFISMLPSLLFLIRKINVIHVPHTNGQNYYGIVFAFMKLLFGVKYVVVLHGGNVDRFKYDIANKFFFKYSDKIIAVSAGIREFYQPLVNKTIIVIPSLIPFKTYKGDSRDIKKQFGLPIESKILLMVGSIKQIKGNFTVLNTFINLGESFIMDNKLHLVFVGDGEDYDLLKKNAINHKYHQHIHLLGRISNEKINEVYSFADIYIISSRFESLSKTMLEAMYNGLPIISSNVKVLNEILTNNTNALFFEQNNEQMLMEKIKKCVEDNVLSKFIGTNAKNLYNNKFSFAKVIEKYLEIYRSL